MKRYEFELFCKALDVYIQNIKPLTASEKIKSKFIEDIELLLKQMKQNRKTNNLGFSQRHPLFCLSDSWLSGFIDAEGSLVCYVNLKKRFVTPQLIIGLHPRDKYVLDEIQNYLGFGIRYARKSGIEIFSDPKN